MCWDFFHGLANIRQGRRAARARGRVVRWYVKVLSKVLGMFRRQPPLSFGDFAEDVVFKLYGPQECKRAALTSRWSSVGEPHQRLG